jgi:uncharacterized SAM-binding protein YcdF (DUF218 family)
LRRLVWLIAAVTIAMLVGFAAFVKAVPEPAGKAREPADGIVALTGEGGRLIPAMDLLQNGFGKRLLITGVNPQTSKVQLRTVLHGGALFDCCVDLGFAALDTRGNAEEAATWARSHGYESLIIVTADYHMPRSLVEFGSEMPEVKLIPYPVRDLPKMPTMQTARRLGGEYLKYVASSIRAAALHAIRQSH